MASQTVSLVAVSENAAKKIALGSGGKIKVQAGTKYLLQTENSQVAPENITVKRIGKDLLVSFEGSEKPDVTLQGFFADGMDSHLYGVSEDGQLHAYLRTDGEGFYGPLLMADGESAPIALGGDGVAYSAPLVGETDDSSGFTLWPLLLGLAGVGAAAAIIHHNRDDGHKTHTSPAPTDIKVMDDVGPIQGQLSNGDITDDAHPAISGNGVPGAIIHLFDNGQEIGSTTVAPDGTWTLTPELADGEHSFDATQVVPGQKPSASVEVIDLIVDTLAPAKPTIEQVLDAVGSIQGPIANGGVTDDPAPTLSGKAEAGSTVTLYDNGQQMGSVVADANGQWSYTPATPLSEGEHLFTVDATDKAGNTSEPSDVFSIITDYTAPVATLTIDVVAGDDIVNLFESKAQQLISGKAGGEFLPGDLVTFTLNGTTYSAAVTHIIDDVGSITGDISQHGVTDDTRPEIQGTSKAGAIVKIFDGSVELGSTTADSKGDWSFKPTKDLAEGEHSIHAEALDKAGNNASSSNFDFRVDTTAPDKPTIDAITDDVGDIQGPIPNHGVTDDSTPTLSGEAEPGSVVTIYDNGDKLGSVVADKDGTWSYTPTTPIAEGEHEFEVTATDKAGNTSVPSDPFFIVTDYTPPDYDKLEITGVLDSVGDITGNIENGGVTDDSRPVINGTGTAGDTIIVYTKDSTGNHEIGRATVGEDGTWSMKPDLPLVQGPNELTAVEMDPAGNKTVPSDKYIIDVETGAPRAPTIEGVYDDVGPYQGFLQKGDVTDDNQPTVNGSAEPGCTVKLYDSNDALIGTAIADANGKWSITPEVPLADGKHEVYATATNPVGVVSEPTGPWNFVVDTTAPDNTTLVVTDHVGDVTGPLHNGDTTDDNKPTFSGDAEPNGKVIIYDNGTPIGSAAVDDDGKWEFTPTKPLNDGPHEFTTEVLDPAGNSSGQGDKLDVIVDTADVVVSITHIIDDVGSITGDISQHGVTDDTRPEIQGTSKAGAIVKIFDGSVELGSTTADSKGDWSFKPTTDLAEGEHSIHAEALDKAGNSASSSNFDFRVDTTAPDKPTIDEVLDDVGSIQGPVANGGETDDPTPTLSGEAEAGSIVTVYDNGDKLGSVVADKDGTWSYTPTTPLNEGVQVHLV